MSLFALIALQSLAICQSAETTADIVECASAEYKIADAAMTGAWRLASARAKNADGSATVSKTPQSYFQVLLDGQRKWIAFRDAHCKAAGYMMRGGSGQGYSTTFCLIELTNQRKRQLDALEF